MDNKNHNNIVVIFVFTCCGGRYRPGSYRLCLPLQFSLGKTQLLAWSGLCLLPQKGSSPSSLYTFPTLTLSAGLGSALSFSLVRKRSSPNLTSTLLMITHETALKNLSLSRYYSSTPLPLNYTLFYQICNSPLINT